MNEKVLQAKAYTFFRRGPLATVTGQGRDGVPAVAYDTAECPPGSFFRAPPDVEQQLVADGEAVVAKLSGPLAALSGVTLGEKAALGAALSGLAVPRVQTWHAVRGERGHWTPAPVRLGPGRSGFDAYFRDAAEITSHWREQPGSIPLFSFSGEHGFRRSFVWIDRALLEIPTETQLVER